MESEIYSGVDPIGGSYAIDFYTRKWSEAIWKNLRR
jgi:methylmalonyl-CoA mutase N-terminal domain/subunit